MTHGIGIKLFNMEDNIIEKQWKLLAKSIGLNDPNSIQYNEMRKAFYGGAGMCFEMVNKSAELPEDDACKIFEEINEAFHLFKEEMTMRIIGIMSGKPN